MVESQENYIIETFDVRKTYFTGAVRVEALRGINLKIQKGEMLAIMGSSGCGKTTLLNCLSTIDDPTSGKVIFEGRNILEFSDNEKSDLRALKMGFIFQSYNLLPVLTALENVELPLMLRGANRADAIKKAKKALEQVGLSDREHHRPPELSGGEQQRVAIARSLVNEPLVIWADEPTGNLDSKNSKQILDLLYELNKNLEQTHVIVTHDIKVANRADRIIKMDNGKII